jgi:hypothetical protein
MAIRTVVTRGYGNGTFNGTIALAVLRGYQAAADTTRVFLRNAVPMGDFLEDSTIAKMFFSPNTSDILVAPSAPFQTSDVVIFKDGSAVEKTSANGLTMTSPFNAYTGVHHLSIDTSNDTGDSGFWAAGSNYEVMLSTEKTVGGTAVRTEIFNFSIQNRQGAKGIVAGAAEAGTLSVCEMTTNLTETTVDHWIGRSIIWTSGDLLQQASAITASSATGMLSFEEVTEAPSVGDTFILV